MLEVKQQLHCLQQSGTDLQEVTPEDYIYGDEEVETPEGLPNGDITARMTEHRYVRHKEDGCAEWHSSPCPKTPTLHQLRVCQSVCNS